MRTRRATEAMLLLTVGGLTAGLYALASASQSAELPADIGPFLGVLFGLFLIAHVVQRRWAPNADPLLLPLAALLNGLGYVFIARLDEDLAGLQATWAILGMAGFVATILLVRRVGDLARYQWTLAGVGIGLLLLPMLPVLGQNVNGARLWVRAGGVSFQPGEFAKIALAIFLAAYLFENKEVLSVGRRKLGPLVVPEPKDLGPLVLAWAASLVVMIFERDLGSSLLFFTLFLVLLWVATGRLSYVIIGVALFAVGSFFAFSAFGHVQERVDTWIDPWEDPLGSGYQLLQAQFAMAEGGLVGTGPGLGEPGRIPAAETDFIFAAIGEELGLAGATVVVIAFLIFVGRGFRIAVNARTGFETLLATGLTTIVAIQAFIIMGGVVRLVPLTGITLPFVSYGGSSLLANYVLLALLARISDRAEVLP
jgi:cell division protein FtsW (lipid II flippase)